MTRERLAENISAFIAAIGEGATNGEVTAAIMRSVDELIAAKLAENGPLISARPTTTLTARIRGTEC